MIYLLLVIGIGITVFGVIRDRGEKLDFSEILGDLEEGEELRLVNHTIEDQELSEGMKQITLELTRLRNAIEREGRRIDSIETKLMIQPKANDIKKSTPETYKEVSQKLDTMKKAKTIDELSKEMEIGKGELQLLQKLQKK